MESAPRSWKRRLKDWSIVIGLLALCLLFGVFVWLKKESTPSQPGGFYTPPNPLPDGAPGLVIRSEPVTRGVPTGTQAWRVLYRSIDMNNRRSP